MRSALITGITGQDGSYLAEFLLDKGYSVTGLVRRTAGADPLSRIRHLLPQLRIVEGDLLDEGSLVRGLEFAEPDEVYNLAAQSHVGSSFHQPVATADITGLGTLRLLETVRKVCPRARTYQASTSELFGISPAPQGEDTPFHPRSPYAVAKLFGHWASINYRESYNMFVATGILFNHESPRRGPEFVTRKISLGVAAIARGGATELRLGNLSARRDWGWAPEYVVAMWKMLQIPEPMDFVIGTGKTHSVQEFCEAAFSAVGLDWTKYVVVDEKLLRPADVHELRADPERAKRELGWEATMQFSDIAAAMVHSDIATSAAVPVSSPARESFRPAR